MIPLASAWTSASVSISDPRAMLTIQVCGFITHSSGAPIRWRVSSVAGAQSTKWSALPQISPIRSTGQRAVAAGAGDREDLHVVRLEHRLISSRPIPPAPITATVEPASVPLVLAASHDQARAYRLMPRMPASSSASASSATCVE